jgi:hypothetical protein
MIAVVGFGQLAPDPESEDIPVALWQYFNHWYIISSFRNQEEG